MNHSLFISVIVTTYNWPVALEKVINALSLQTYRNFEIIIADDGSSKETENYITAAKQTLGIPLQHVWQEDAGFQAAKIRNKAVAKSKGDYLVFIDGDCIPLNNFLARHVLLAESNWFVTGNRILLNETFTQLLLRDENLSLLNFSFSQWVALWKSGSCNRLQPLLFLPLFPRKLQPNQWKGAKTCNLGMWRENFLAINGFDESYQGWGHEDSDLVIRLIKSGIKRKEGRFAIPVIHLWHKESDRLKQPENLLRFKERLKDSVMSAPVGIDQYLGG